MKKLTVNRSLTYPKFVLVPLMALTSLMWLAAPSHADDQVCNQNPGSQRGVVTLSSNSATVQGYVLKVELRYNRQTGEKWTRACIPSGTRLYLKDDDGREYGAYEAQVHGWNYAEKIRDNRPLRACVKHPHDSRELCTSSG
jgi:hypothetical protein